MSLFSLLSGVVLQLQTELGLIANATLPKVQGFFCQILLEYYSLQARGTSALPLVKFGNASNCNPNPNAFWTLNSCLNHCVPLDNKVKQTHRPMSYLEHVAFFKITPSCANFLNRKKEGT